MRLATDSRADLELNDSTFDSALFQGRLLASQIKAQWRSGGTPDGCAAIEKNPSLRNYKSLVLDLAFEEYCLRAKAGQAIDTEQFVSRYPSIDRSLFRLIDVHQYFEQHPALLEDKDEIQWPALGDRLFDFLVLEEIGRGALARVYLCTEEKIGRRQVVVKVARGGAYEAEALGKLSHRNIVPIYSVIEDPLTATSGLCMPFRGRSTLCDVLDCAFEGNTRPSRGSVILEAARQHVLASDQYDGLEPVCRSLQHISYTDAVCGLGLQLASALKHAHERGIAHADLKPSNVLISPSGTPMLLDFNLSVSDSHDDPVTGGTLPYMAPECIQSVVLRETAETPNRYQCDVYSLGVILFELLSGQIPFRPKSLAAAQLDLAQEILDLQEAGCPSLQTLNPAVDRLLASIVERCLDRNPERRPASMEAVEQLLTQYQSRRNRSLRFTKRHKWKLLAGGMAMLLFASAALIFQLTRDPLHMRRYALAQQLHGQQRYPEAIENLNLAIKEQPQFHEAYHERGRAFLAMGDYPSALQDFEKAHELQPTGYHAAGVALCMDRLFKHASAYRWYRQAIADGFETGGLYNNLGYSCAMTHQYAAAEQAFARAAEIGASPITVGLNRARLAEAQAISEAKPISASTLLDIEKLIELEPGNSNLHFLAATLYGLASKQNKKHSAPTLRHLEQALKAGMDLGAMSLEENPAFSFLAGNEAFQKLLTTQTTKQPSPASDLMLSPWD